MDQFFEQIIERKKKPAEKVMRILLVLAAVIAIALLVLSAVLRIVGPFSSLLLLVALGIGAAVYFMLNNLNVEYEYTVTNAYFDVDKIMGKRKRKRMISTACTEFETFGDYNKDRKALEQRQFDTKVFAANLMDEGLYYATLRHKNKGHVLLVIEPNERVLGALKKFIPRQVSKNVFSWNRPD